MRNVQKSCLVPSDWNVWFRRKETTIRTVGQNFLENDVIDP